MTASDPRPVGEDDLHAFVDGRLDPGRRARVEVWLAAHPEAAARVAADREVRDRLRARLAPVADEPIPARLRIANLAGPRRRRIPRGWPNAAAAALLLALGGAVGWVGRGAVPGSAPAEPMTQAAVSAFRTYVVEAAHPVEVRADGSTDLVRWLSARLRRPVVVPDLRAQGFRLMGGRLLPAGDEPAAMLMYDDDRGTRLTLYSRAGPTGGRGVFRYARADDVAAFSWIDAGMSYVVTARTDEARLLQVAEAVDAQASGKREGAR
ncbi:MAG: anti-sigma factor [Methylobacteriaceae bacterium]|jgi:anti-sigma factor RsiW|uniref:Anti-sigma factor family protein n=1 Tax=Methylorubrum zatmanii TaxID=29429 RepID=A0ABW1WNF3_9HYPH|nr:MULTISPECIES: anti-sigma factor [Methylorubrum]MBB5764461.1 anti-sigma factor RsiW [Methylorubrum rhodesianum]MBD8908309.1 anti-sigma factor [Methylorubrum zatmanii]MDV2987635.1 anti-sigma factor [Methylobacteriaceae bacterium AG10]